ncbi:MAG: serine protease [Cryobacterium sp.]
MSHLRRVSVLLLALAVSAVGMAAVTPPADRDLPVPLSRDGVRVPTGFDLESYRAEQRQLHLQLAGEQVALGLERMIVVPVNQQRLMELEQTACPTCPRPERALRAGYVEDVGVPVSFAEVLPEMLDGRAHPVARGAVRGDHQGFVYTTAVHSPGAAGLRIHFTDFFLAPGSELWVYGPQGGAFGPYTLAGSLGTGDFYANTVPGDTAIVQLRHRGDVGRGLNIDRFEIADIAYVGGPAVRQQAGGAIYQASDLCADNADCINAAGGNEGWNDAIALMYYVQRPYMYICSGGALADAATSAAPYYFLTANHCISSDRVAGTLETYWGFLENDCADACAGPCSAVPRTLGATVASTNKTADYTLLSLNSPPPYGAYLGWDATPIYDTDGAALQRLSHPSGSPQAFSTHSVDTTPPVVCSGWSRGPWIYSHDLIGATEGGSSGSPVLNSSGEVVGQLSGGCGYDVYNTCNNTDNSTVDGAFAYYYASISGLLGGGGGTTNQPPTASFTFDCTDLSWQQPRRSHQPSMSHLCSQ